MLNKLIKHEFRATGRIMLPLLAAELLLSVLAGLSARGMERMEDMSFLGGMYIVVLVTFFLGLFAIGVVALVLMIQRFYKSLLRDEGYLSMTLPVSVDGHIWAKLIVSFVWFAAVALVSALAMLVVISIGADRFLSDMFRFDISWDIMREELAVVGGGNIALFFLELLVLAFLGIGAVCLRCYASMAIGCSAANHKLLLSFVAYFVIGIVLSLIANTLTFAVLPHLDVHFLFDRVEDTMLAAHAFMGINILGSALMFALFYFVTRWFLKNRLNLA